MTRIRLMAHRNFAASLSNGAVLVHWHQEDGRPWAHVVSSYRPEDTVADLEAAAARHLEEHGPLQEDDGGCELPVLI